MIARRRRFFELADRLARSSKAAEQQRIKKELARLTFGDQTHVREVVHDRK